MTYAFSCPIEGCTTILTADASTRSEAVDALTRLAKDHLEISHPDIKKSDQQIRDDVETGTILQGESNIKKSTL